jgi:hypothetical protein
MADHHRSNEEDRESNQSINADLKDTSQEKDNKRLQSVRSHLRAFIDFKKENFTEEEFKTEAASHNAQWKIKEYLESQKKKTGKPVWEIIEGFGKTCQKIQEDVLGSLTLTDSQIKRIKALCKNEEMPKTDFYNHLKEDAVLKTAWNKRILEKKNSQAPESLKRKYEALQAENTNLKAENAALKAEILTLKNEKAAPQTENELFEIPLFEYPLLYNPSLDDFIILSSEPKPCTGCNDGGPSGFSLPKE